MADILIPDLQETIRKDIAELGRLIKKLKPKAKEGDEAAISAIVKAMQVRQKMIAEYHAAQPKEESSVERFRKQREARQGKTSRKFGR